MEFISSVDRFLDAAQDHERVIKTRRTGKELDGLYEGADDQLLHVSRAADVVELVGSRSDAEQAMKVLRASEEFLSVSWFFASDLKSKSVSQGEMHLFDEGFGHESQKILDMVKDFKTTARKDLSALD